MGNELPPSQGSDNRTSSNGSKSPLDYLVVPRGQGDTSADAPLKTHSVSSPIPAKNPNHALHTLGIPHMLGRRNYLEAVTRGEIAPGVIVSGLPGGGKTTALNFLQQGSDITFTPVTRFMPRGRRPSDTAGDKPWAFEPVMTPGGDPSGPDSVIFANVKYKGYYGFPGTDIVNAIKNGEIPVMLVTSYVEMTQLAEAFHNTMPVAPLITLRLEVPQEVLPSRIMGRIGADPREHEERLTRLHGLVRADLLQTRPLNTVYGTRVIWNVTPQEVQQHGYFASQIQSLTPDALAAMIVEARVEALDRARQEAKDILAPRVLTYDSPVVPRAITEVLDRVLIPTAKQRLFMESEAEPEETPLVLKAGLAAAIYLGDKGRIVSPDIDFVLRQESNKKLIFESLMEGLCPEPVTWTDGKNKAVYHCEGIKGEARAADGTLVELDALYSTNVQPDARGFVFNCTHDECDLFHRRMVITPAGNKIAMIPPEQLCVEKLLAGRGPDINKFDLFDASGLLAQYHLNPHIIKKMIESQRYDPTVDEAATQVLAERHGPLSDDALVTVGVSEPLMRLIARGMGELVDDPAAEYPSESRILTFTTLKQLSFLSCVERSLKKIETILHHKVFAIDGDKVSISERFGEHQVREGIARLRAQIQLHAEFYVGMHDTFVRRPLTQPEETERFFKHLDDQRARLTQQH
jgi:hypothetical protein